MVGTTNSYPDTSVPTEDLVKVAFLYNFVQFVEWPSKARGGDDAPVYLCVLGNDVLEPAFQSINGKTAKGRKLLVRFARELNEIGECHLMFVARSEKMHMSSIVQQLQDRPILTVSDMADFARLGGVIGLITVDNKIRFEINVNAARRAGIKISSRLLNLARIIDE